MYFEGINICHVEINSHGHIFIELIEILRDQLTDIGIATTVSKNQLFANHLNILVGHTAFLAEEVYDSFKSSGLKYIVFQAEALCKSDGFSAHLHSYLDFIKTSTQIWDYSPTNKSFLEAQGCRNFYHIPIGFISSLQKVKHAKDKDIDILFYGAPKPRRNTILNSLVSHGIRTESLFGSYGNARDQMIARAKIIINIHQFDTTHLEEVRLSYLLNNRCFVISESADRDPYQGGVIFADYENLVECCKYYLQPNMENERDRVAATGLERLKAIPMKEKLQASLCLLAFKPSKD